MHPVYVAVDGAALIAAVHEAKQHGLPDGDVPSLELLAAGSDPRVVSFHKVWLLDSKPPKPENFAASLRNLANSLKPAAAV